MGLKVLAVVPMSSSDASLARRSGRRASGAAVLAIAAVLGLVIGTRAAPPARTATGDCTPSPSWGTLASADVEAQVVQLVNAHRAALGLRALVQAKALTASAEWKSMNMAGYGYMQHDDPAPVARTVTDRLAACGYPTDAGRLGREHRLRLSPTRSDRHDRVAERPAAQGEHRGSRLDDDRRRRRALERRRRLLDAGLRHDRRLGTCSGAFIRTCTRTAAGARADTATGARRGVAADDASGAAAGRGPRGGRYDRT